MQMNLQLPSDQSITSNSAKSTQNMFFPNLNVANIHQ